jgi:hypothetical protein
MCEKIIAAAAVVFNCVCPSSFPHTCVITPHILIPIHTYTQQHRATMTRPMTPTSFLHAGQGAGGAPASTADLKRRRGGASASPSPPSASSSSCHTTVTTEELLSKGPATNRYVKMKTNASICVCASGVRAGWSEKDAQRRVEHGMPMQREQLLHVFSHVPSSHRHHTMYS